MLVKSAAVLVVLRNPFTFGLETNLRFAVSAAVGKMFLKFVSNMCRVCMDPKGEVGIFDDETSDKFRFLTLLDISDKDNLPSHLCLACSRKLKIAYEFKNQAIASDTHLRTFINSINTKFSALAETHKKEAYTNLEEINALLPAGETATIAKVAEDIQESEDLINNAQIELLEDGDAGGIFENYCEKEDINTDDERMEQDEDSKEASTVEQVKVEITRYEDSLACAECNKRFSTKPNLMRHILTHTKTRPYKCTICGSQFTQNGSLKQHMMTHTGERPYKCNVCRKSFTRKTMLSIHMRTHTGEKPYQCSECNYTFSLRAGLKKHMDTAHRKSNEKFPCTICDKVLRSKYSLTMHLSLHTDDEQKHECPICLKTFSNKYNLKYHIKNHESDEKYVCLICDKSLSCKSKLKYHLSTHSKEKEEFRCSVCEETFSKKFQLLAHLQTHESKSNSNFSCRKCKKEFTLRENLLEHLRNHVDNTAPFFRCSKCDIAFNVKRNLKLHLLNYHKEHVPDLNNCDICDIPFVSVTHLNEHIAKKHDVVDEKCDECCEKFTSKRLFLEHCILHDIVDIREDKQ